MLALDMRLETIRKATKIDGRIINVREALMIWPLWLANFSPGVRAGSWELDMARGQRRVPVIHKRLTQSRRVASAAGAQKIINSIFKE